MVRLRDILSGWGSAVPPAAYLDTWIRLKSHGLVAQSTMVEKGRTELSLWISNSNGTSNRVGIESVYMVCDVAIF